ncbi:SagB family peptide dehydrogenase [Micromonospora sp. NBC_01739]|uniref:SagB family peptide dehydrogenase n=1 Tax=Micromonospora sp. NBC_01739 TaxID=2975985 RepID=UPI002E0D75D8|nr:SagB family peptide dehydrogenase [Micromonospora sp. NBC_01739]
MLPLPLWSFRDDVFVEDQPANAAVVLHSRSGESVLTPVGPAIVQALKRMSLGPTALSNVITEESDWTALRSIIDDHPHLVVHSYGLDPQQPLISVEPLTPAARLAEPAAVPQAPVRLSRFAVIRAEGGTLVIESPLCLHRVILHGPEAVAALATLIRPAVPDFDDPVVRALISPLVMAGMLVDNSGQPLDGTTTGGDTDPALLGWDPAELFFHTRATLGRHDHDFGATYPLGETGRFPPVVKPPAPGPAIELYRPTGDDGPGLVETIEAPHGSGYLAVDPVSDRELGTLLYRTARVRSTTVGDPHSAAAASDRPYSSPGRSYELEIYATVHHCDGVPRGVYHYDPAGHRLEPLAVSGAEADEMLETSRVAANLSSLPGVLLSVTARFERVSWKYSGLGYSLVLRNFGALTQLMSLACTALGLSGLRIDAAEIEATSRILGLDWRVEPGVGSFAIGRPVVTPTHSR